MGINGLLPVVKPIGVLKNVANLANKRVGIDVYGWIHRGTFSCALEVCRDEPTTAYIDYCLHRVRMLRAHNAVPILVFDGAELPQKSGTHVERRTARIQNRVIAEASYNAGDIRKAREYYQRACPVTNAMARRVFAAAVKLGVECIVAPYEADAQLAWMMRTNYCDVIISEDSDLLVYGASCVVYKFGRDGTGLMVELCNLRNVRDINLTNFTPDMFTLMCVCAGCDFFKGVKGLGIRKAHALVKRHRTLARTIRAVQLDSRLRIDRQAFAKEFTRACLVFKHQTVLDLNTKQTVPLHPIDDSVFEPIPNNAITKTDDGAWDLSFLGKQLDSQIALQISQGHVNPHTLEPYDEPLHSLTVERPLATTARISTPTPTPRKPSSVTVNKPPSGFLVQPASSFTSSADKLRAPSLRQRISNMTDPHQQQTPQRSSVSDIPSSSTAIGATRSNNSNPLFDPRRYRSGYTSRTLGASSAATPGVWAKFKRSSGGGNSGGQSNSNTISALARAPQPRHQKPQGLINPHQRPNLLSTQTAMATTTPTSTKSPAKGNITNNNEDEDGDDSEGHSSPPPSPLPVSSTRKSSRTVRNLGAMSEADDDDDDDDNDADDGNIGNSTDLYAPPSQTYHTQNSLQSPNPERLQGVNNVLSKFAARPVVKRLKFADQHEIINYNSQLVSKTPAALQHQANLDFNNEGENSRGGKVNNPSLNGVPARPPSPDQDSFRLFDEIDDLSKDGVTPAAKPTNTTPTKLATPNAAKYKAKSTGPASAQRSPSVSALKKPSSTEKPMRQVLVSRFFAGGAGSASATTDRAKAVKSRVDSQRRTEYQDETDEQSPSRRTHFQKKDEHINLDSGNNERPVNLSPTARVETAMSAAGFSIADQKRAQKRRIDNFRKDVVGKKIRVGSSG